MREYCCIAVSECEGPDGSDERQGLHDSDTQHQPPETAGISGWHGGKQMIKCT